MTNTLPSQPHAKADAMSIVREFFTEAEWDLIYSLAHNNREFCQNDEFDPESDPRSDYDSILEKIYRLFDLVYIEVLD